MDIKEFLETLQEGKGANVRYVVVVNGERYATFDNEDDAIKCENSFYNMDSDAEAYYGMFPDTKIIKEYVECYDDELEESLAQEIGQEYRRLSKKYGIDFNDLVYGKDGFMKSMYPDNPDYVYFPDFNGDVIFSEKHWNELVDWAEKNKGIKLDKWEKSEDKYNDFLEESKLNEAPDELGFETDDEIEAQMKAEMEKRKAERDAKKQAELDRQEQEKQAELRKQDFIKKGKELYNKCDSLVNFEDWFDVLVPSSGKADTVAGEIVRAFNRILYRKWNDGDVFFEGYGRETCGSSAVYLVSIIRDQDIVDKFYEMAEDNVSNNRYDEIMNIIEGELQEYLLSNPELFGQENTTDSRDGKEWNVDDEFPEPSDYEYQIYLGDYYWEAPNGEEIYLRDYINNGDIDIWKVQDTFNDFYFGDKVSYHMERPWTHYDDTIYLTEMTKDSYETIQQETEDIHLFDDLIEELYNKYGDPNEEEE